LDGMRGGRPAPLSGLGPGGDSTPLNGDEPEWGGGSAAPAPTLMLCGGLGSGCAEEQARAAHPTRSAVASSALMTRSWSGDGDEPGPSDDMAAAEGGEKEEIGGERECKEDGAVRSRRSGGMRDARGDICGGGRDSGVRLRTPSPTSDQRTTITVSLSSHLRIRRCRPSLCRAIALAAIGDVAVRFDCDSLRVLRSRRCTFQVRRPASSGGDRQRAGKQRGAWTSHARLSPCSIALQSDLFVCCGWRCGTADAEKRKAQEAGRFVSAVGTGSETKK
jgi:hypothetical protein